ncbi:hypothetical protein MKX03_004436 [Papaver bracteatum]|nr:hypothetical protein MKX03_004436 [Papaver bracteatum]
MPKGFDDDEAKLASLPSGFKVKPTDRYLGEALPVNIRKEVFDFYDHHPKKLTQDYKGYEPNHWYLFTRKCYEEKPVGGNRAHCTVIRIIVDNTNMVRIRVAGFGLWLSTTPRTSIYSSGKSTNLIRCKDTWVYHEVRGSKAYITEYGSAASYKAQSPVSGNVSIHMKGESIEIEHSDEEVMHFGEIPFFQQ